MQDGVWKYLAMNIIREHIFLYDLEVQRLASKCELLTNKYPPRVSDVELLPSDALF